MDTSGPFHRMNWVLQADVTFELQQILACSEEGIEAADGGEHHRPPK